MARYLLTQRAEQDYREILAFTLNEWGVEQFTTYATLLDNAFERLVDMPRLGIRRDDIREGYYCYRVGQHYVFYRINGDRIEVVRILHTKRKMTQDLFSNDF
jgi:toxin ParE1/3/4